MLRLYAKYTFISIDKSKSHHIEKDESFLGLSSLFQSILLAAMAFSFIILVPLATANVSVPDRGIKSQ